VETESRQNTNDAIVFDEQDDQTPPPLHPSLEDRFRDRLKHCIRRQLEDLLQREVITLKDQIKSEVSILHDKIKSEVPNIVENSWNEVLASNNGPIELSLEQTDPQAMEKNQSPMNIDPPAAGASVDLNIPGSNSGGLDWEYVEVNSFQADNEDLVDFDGFKVDITPANSPSSDPLDFLATVEDLVPSDENILYENFNRGNWSASPVESAPNSDNRDSPKYPNTDGVDEALDFALPALEDDLDDMIAWWLEN
jgi:hypothetical protein